MPNPVKGWMSPRRNTVRVELSKNGTRGCPELGRACALCCGSQSQAPAAAGWVKAEPQRASKTLAMGIYLLKSQFAHLKSEGEVRE